MSPQTAVVELSIASAPRAIVEAPPNALEFITMTDPFELADQWGPEKVVLVFTQGPAMQGVLVIDNTARGLGKGGTPMSPTLSVGEVARLARTHTPGTSRTREAP